MNRQGIAETRGTRLLGREQAATYLGMTTRSLHWLVARGFFEPYPDQWSTSHPL